MNTREGQVAALRDIADGLNAGLPRIHGITIGINPITVQVIGDQAESVDQWLAYFESGVKGAVTDPNWGRGKVYYSGRVVLEEGATLEFWDVLKVPTDDELRAENDRLRAELAALRTPVVPEDEHRYECCGKVGRISRHEPWCPTNKTEDSTPPGTGHAPAADMAVEAAGAPDLPEFELGPVEDEPHVCEYVEPDGTTMGVCHLSGVHGGRPAEPDADGDLIAADEESR